MRLALFTWRRQLGAALALGAVLLCSAALAVLVMPPQPGPAQGTGVRSPAPSPSLHPGEVLLVVTVPTHETRHLETGESVVLVELEARAGPSPQAAGSEGPPRARLLWRREPAGSASASSVTLGLAVEEKAALRVAASARSGGLAVLRSGHR